MTVRYSHMIAPARSSLAPLLRRVRFVLLTLVFSVFGVSPASAQEDENKPLSLRGLAPIGARNSLTEAWGTLQFTVTNPNSTGRDARVVVSYPERPEVQYARDIWVPGRSSITSWLTIGPAPAQRGAANREFTIVLHDRTGGTDTVVLPPGEERIRSRAGFYRQREPTTTILADVTRTDPGEESLGLPPELVTFVRLPRAVTLLSASVSEVHAGPLPLAPEALDGVDVFVVAGNRLTEDPPGAVALRRWVEEGGRLWVMLDRVDAETVAPILGEDSPISVVDRVGLTTLRLQTTNDPRPEPVREVEQPVPFVRVIPSAIDKVLVTADRWPAAFVRRVGRGKVLFTTLGPAAWSRPRGPGESRVPSPYPALRGFPIPLNPVGLLATELHPAPVTDTFPPDVFQPMLADEIGYSIVGRGTAAVILGAFVAALAAIGIVLRRSPRSVMVGWLLPLVALVAAGAFVVLGERSRRAVPPTIGIAALVEPVSGHDESVVTGLFAVYHPSSGPVTLGSRDGVELGLDTEGLAGQHRTRVQTDSDAWHWDGLALPAGIRTGPLRTTLKTGRVTASARLGPNGIEGRLDAGAFRGLSDAVLSTRAREPLSLSLGADGTFACGTANALPPGEYLSGTVLNDRQQRRQAIYRQLHTGAALKHHEGDDLLLIWADPPDLPIVRQEGARLVGGVLLAVPVEFERTPANTPVTVPRGLLPYKRMLDDKSIPVTLEGAHPVNMPLRFQIPPSVLPLRVERATLFIQARAPFRRLSVAGVRDKRPVPLFEVSAPVDPIRIDITDPDLLRLDAQGGLYLNVAVSGPSGGPVNDVPWKIESLSLELSGRTE